MQKYLFMLLITVSMLLSACKKNETDNSMDSSSLKPIQVAMCLSGDINDGGWNQSAYGGLIQAEEDYGVEIAYTESIDQENYESTVRDYAVSGYDLILCVGAEFADAVAAVGPDFPDVKFANFNGNIAIEPNVASYRYTTTETGFLAGVVCAILSDTGVVGYIAGTSAAHIQDAVAAFKAGVAYINPSYIALDACIDSYEDVAFAKEMARSMINQGADVLLGNANTASRGVIEACSSAGIKAVGYISDQYRQAPETVQVSVIQDNATMINVIVKSVVSESFHAGVNLYGMDSGAIYLSDWHGHDADLDGRDIRKIDDTIDLIRDGTLKEEGILPKTSFE